MTERLPIFPLQTVLFPGALLPLHIFEPRYRRMLLDSAGRNPIFGVVLTRSGSEVGDQPDTCEIGTGALNVEHISLPDGRSNLLVKGAQRFRILASDWDQSYMMATVEWLGSAGAGNADAAGEDAAGHIRELLGRYVDAYNRATGHHAALRQVDEDPVAAAYAVASALPIPLAAKQRLLEASPPADLLSLLEETLRHETAILTKAGAFVPLSGYPGGRFTRN